MRVAVVAVLLGLLAGCDEPSHEPISEAPATETPPSAAAQPGPPAAQDRGPAAEEPPAPLPPPAPPEDPFCRILGRVVDRQGSPVAGARVSWHAECLFFERVTDEQGRFSYEDLGPGSWLLEAEGGVVRTPGGSFSSARGEARVRLARPQQTAVCEIRLDHDAALYVRAPDRFGGDLLLFPAEYPAEEPWDAPLPEGEWSEDEPPFWGLMPGPYRLECYAFAGEEYFFGRQTLVLACGENRVDLALEPAATLRGTVVDLAGDALASWLFVVPQEAGRVFWSFEDGWAPLGGAAGATEPDGSFTIPLTPDRWRVIAVPRDDAFARAEVAVDVAAGEDRPLRLTADRTSPMLVGVTGGHPRDVSIHGPVGVRAMVFGSAVRVSGLLPGDMALLDVRGEDLLLCGRTEIRPGEEAPEVRLGPRGEARIVVLGPTGDPVGAGVYVRITPVCGEVFTYVAPEDAEDAPGWFRSFVDEADNPPWETDPRSQILAELYPGRYRLDAPGTSLTFDVGPGEQRAIELRLPEAPD